MFQLGRLALLSLLTSFLISSSVAIPTNIWHVSIFQGPAPAPEDGPPLSASALRDPSFIPIQVGSIVGAYLLFVIATVIALLLVGRRLRRAAQASPRTLAMELLKPGKNGMSDTYGPATANPYGPSLISTVDIKNSTWPSPDKSKSSAIWPSIGNKHNKQASMQSSVITFDDTVIEDDRTRNQNEMDRLYAAVMAHEERKSSSRVDLTGQPNPPELQHLRSGPSAPHSSLQPPSADTKPMTASLRKQSRPSPITTNSRLSSRSSLGSFGRKRGVRDLPIISPPMGSPDLVSGNASIYGDAEPLTPRLYEPGPPPPTPPLAPPAGSEEPQEESSRSPRRARFGFGRTPRTSGPTTSTFPEPNLRPELRSHPSEHSIPFRSHPTEHSIPLRSHPTEHSIPLRDLAKQKRAPAPLALRPVGPGSSNTRNAPLLSAPLPLRNRNPSNTSDRPPSMIKATVLERKIPEHLRGPKTGVPGTPYSPYMPFTPLTPMTPSRLVTKHERRRMEKEAGRRVATMEDAVEEESEMWGDGFK